MPLILFIIVHHKLIMFKTKLAITEAVKYIYLFCHQIITLHSKIILSIPFWLGKFSFLLPVSAVHCQTFLLGLLSNLLSCNKVGTFSFKYIIYLYCTLSVYNSTKKIVFVSRTSLLQRSSLEDSFLELYRAISIKPEGVLCLTVIPCKYKIFLAETISCKKKIFLAITSTSFTLY